MCVLPQGYADGFPVVLPVELSSTRMADLLRYLQVRGGQGMHERVSVTCGVSYYGAARCGVAWVQAPGWMGHQATTVRRACARKSLPV